MVNKGATKKPKNEKDNKCFQYPINLALYYKIKKKDLQKILKIKWGDIDFSSYQKDWEKIEQNNTSVALNVVFESYNSKEIKFANISKYNYKHKN